MAPAGWRRPHRRRRRGGGLASGALLALLLGASACVAAQQQQQRQQQQQQEAPSRAELERLRVRGGLADPLHNYSYAPRVRLRRAGISGGADGGQRGGQHGRQRAVVSVDGAPFQRLSLPGDRVASHWASCEAMKTDEAVRAAGEEERGGGGGTACEAAVAQRLVGVASLGRVRRCVARWGAADVLAAPALLDGVDAAMLRGWDVEALAAHLKPRLEAAVVCERPLEWVLRQELVSQRGLWLEFGVFEGATLNLAAARRGPRGAVFGFDNFTGLPEMWRPSYFGAKGSFGLGGVVPPLLPNARVVKGLFEDTLGPFLAKHPGERVAYLHVDCDLYVGAKQALDAVGPLLMPGAVVIFDDLVNFRGFRNRRSELRALLEWLQSGTAPRLAPLAFGGPEVILDADFDLQFWQQSAAFLVLP